MKREATIADADERERKETIDHSFFQKEMMRISESSTKHPGTRAKFPSW